MNIVLDTNVILSAFLTEGIAHKVFNHCLINHNIYVSEYIIDELTRILKSKFKVSINDVKEFVEFINSNLIVALPENEIPDICRDINDNQILQLADFVKANKIISGDKDLLVIKEYGNIEIISPRDYFNIHLVS